MECPVFHEFHDDITNDGLFFGLLERAMKLNNIRLLSALFTCTTYVIKFLHDAYLSFQVLADIGPMKRTNDFDCDDLICVDFSSFVHCTEGSTIG